MLAAIGIILMAKQVPLLLGYDKADFWTKELFNIISFDNTFQHVKTFIITLRKGLFLLPCYL